MKKKINWESIDKQIKQLKNPLSFIYTIIKLQDKIDDYSLSLIIRFFFKNKTEVSLKYPLFVMINILSDDFIITKKVVNDYYSSVLKKHIFIQTILKFKKSFEKELFWEKDFVSQKFLLENLLLIFKSHFDCSITGFNGLTKFLSQLKLKNNIVIFSEIKNRYLKTLQIFGLNFFKFNNINIVDEEEFEEMDTPTQIKFLICYYLKVEKCLNILINVYDLIKIYDNKLKQIITPQPITINLNTIYSDNDSDDIHLLMES